MASTARKWPMSLVQDVITPMIPHIAETEIVLRNSGIMDARRTHWYEWSMRQRTSPALDVQKPALDSRKLMAE
jgi:hypothetical protein